ARNCQCRRAGSGTTLGRRTRERGDDGHRGESAGPARDGRAGHGHCERRGLRLVHAVRHGGTVRGPALAHRRAARPCGARRGPARSTHVITLVLGGTRSGKSEVAARLAAASGGPVTVVVTAAPSDDADFSARIAAHRARRPPEWATVEETHDVA